MLILIFGSAAFANNMKPSEEYSSLGYFLVNRTHQYKTMALKSNLLLKITLFVVT